MSLYDAEFGGHITYFERKPVSSCEWRVQTHFHDLADTCRGYRIKVAG